MLHGAIRLWRHGANGPQIFFELSAGCGIQSMDKSAKLNSIVLTVKIEFHAFMHAFKSSYTVLRLIENNFSFVLRRPLGMDFLLLIIDKSNLPNSTSIDHNSLACCFFFCFLVKPDFL